MVNDNQDPTKAASLPIVGEPSDNAPGIEQQLLDSTYKGQKQNYDDAINAAKGDPEAQTRVAQNSAGVAAGTLEMTPEARAARAEKMGFDTSKTYYHGTKKGDVSRFDIDHPSSTGGDPRGAIFLSEDPELASKFTGGAYDQGARSRKPGGGNVIPVHTSVKNTFDYDNPEHIKLIQEALPRFKYEGSAIFKDLKNGEWPIMEDPYVQKIIKNSGFDSFYVQEKGVKNLGVYDPSHIRSKFAEFDPTKAGKYDISYAEGGDIMPEAGPTSGDVTDSISIPQGAAPQTAAEQQPQGDSTNMVSPQGDLVSVHNSQLKAALHPVNGYRVATPDDVTKYKNEQKYGTPGQQLQTGVEGAVRTATFGAVPGFGKAEDIRGRQTENPISSGFGEAIPFIAEQFAPGVGAIGAITAVPKAITGAGEAIKAASGLTGVGAKALQYAAEGAIMQGSSEVSKMLLKDPDSSVPNALVNEGMAALLGGALGAAAGGIGKTASLWESKFGGKAADAVIDKSLPDIATQELHSGMEIPGTLRDALSGNQDAYNRVQVLQKADDTYAGKLMRKDIDSVYGQAQDKALETLGADHKLVDKAPDAYATGIALKDALTEGVKAGRDVYGPIYDKLKPQYKNIPIHADQKASLAGALMNKLSEAGIGTLEGSAERSTMNNLFKSLDSITNAEGIKNLNTGLNNAAKNPEIQRLAAVAGPTIKEFESNIIQSHLGATDATGELLKSRKIADEAYKHAMGIMSDLKTSLGLGRFKGPNGFLRALEEKAPEQIAQRLSTKNRQELIELLEKKFPKAAEILKGYHLNNMLHDAEMKTGGLNTRKFLNNFLDTGETPQHIQNLVAGKDGLATTRLRAIKDILNALPADGNPSNTASMLNKLWSGKVGTIAGGILGVGGHGHLTGGMLGGLGEKVLSEIKPFLSYKILEMRAAGTHIVPGNVKALMDYAHSVAQGHALVGKAVNSIFNANAPTLPASKMPKDADRKSLDKSSERILKDPTALTNTAKNLQSILPDHAPTLGMTATKTANYINSIKPRPSLGLPMDSKIPPTKGQISEYNRQLDIIQQPLIAIQHIKTGSLTPQDIKTLETCHPGMCQQLRREISSHLNEASTLPYKTKLSLSLFMAQPMDSTMTPMAIVSAQPMPAMVPQQQGGAAPKKISQSAASGLNKMAGMYKTQGQSAEANKNKH